MRVLFLIAYFLTASFALAATSTLQDPSSATPESQRIFLHGMDDINTDRATIQAAIDGAPSGTTIILVGHFQLDGEAIVVRRAPLTLKGWTVDNDGDGHVNEDWEDGIDNDHDGRVDEDGWDTVIQGVLGEDGLPVGEDPSTGTFFNRALRFHGASGGQHRLVIRDLEFRGHHRTITLQPDVDSTSNNCVDFATTDGFLDRARIERNLFTNNSRAVQVFGDVRGLRIRRNVMRGGTNASVLIVGGTIGCTGDAASVPIARPANLRVHRNLILDGTIGIFGSSTDNLRVTRNVVDTTGFLGIFSADDSRPRVQNNLVAHATRGVTISGPSMGGRVVGNEFFEIADRAINVVSALGPVTGFRIRHNQFVDTVNEDIRLDTDTSGNLVVVGPDAEVIDLGDNTVRVESDDAQQGAGTL